MNISILVTFQCDYPECGRSSEPVPGYLIDKYEWHDAPSDGFTAEPPVGWLHDILYHWVGCPEHKDAMRANRAAYEQQ